MIKIWGSPNSSAGRVYWMLEELGLKYETMPLDMRAKEHKGDEYMKLNPNGKVPVLVDDDFVIWESMAITTYLAKKEKSPLAPATAREEGLSMQWSLWALNELQEPAVNWLIQEIFVPTEKKNYQIIEESKRVLPHLLKVLNGELAKTTFLAADRFTVADLNVASVVSLIQALGFDIAAFPHVQKWMSMCADRPAFQKLAKMRGA
ncbi:glutathione S-transferase family protein [Bdellovibrio sp. 22V]|uniref:glutathione S-transferase family protein n=1 Tax=Bdellovibrio TaxID=958 RepID=UPI0025431ED8|nr:glutathione S-transferase family protein [Bdellovibrio sp. 22V]WII72563.1 glutathione S-transferase family protein [Bdellovibrio sp. 22V]